MEINRHYFFKPNVGGLYKRGLLNRKKVMILGASFYCPKTECVFYDECTYQGRTEEFDKTCPYNNGRPLSELPSTEIDEEGATSYKRFYEFMVQYLHEKGVDDISDFYSFWDHVAFTNYIQHEIGGRTTTMASDISDNDLLALGDAIEDIKPDIVIIWGCVVNGQIKTKMDDKDDPHFKNDFDGSDDSHYLFHWLFHGRVITFLNFYHPSSGHFFWKDERAKMRQFLDKAFEE